MIQTGSAQRAAAVMLIFALTIIFLVAGRPFLVPVAIALLFTFLLLPISRMLERKGVHRTLAIFISLLIAYTILAAFLFLIYYEVMIFIDDGPVLKQKFNERLLEFQKYVSSHFNI